MLLRNFLDCSCFAVLLLQHVRVVSPPQEPGPVALRLLVLLLVEVLIHLVLLIRWPAANTHNSVTLTCLLIYPNS